MEWMVISRMKKNNIGYLLREGIRSVFLHGFMSFAAIWVTVACLLIMGTFALVLFNLNEMIEDLERNSQVVVFVDESYDGDKVQQVGSQINMIENVYEAEPVSRKEAMEDFMSDLEGEGDIEGFAGVDETTFRDRFIVSMVDNNKMEKTCDEIAKIEGVADVRAPYKVAEGFQMIQRILNIASMIIILMLFIVSVLIISNTVKLAMYDRKEEIAIMKMVGATNGFIRWPFVVEGFILGFVASVLSFFLQWGLYNFLLDRVTSMDTLRLFDAMVPFVDVVEVVAICFAAVGFVVGVFGSLLSIRKFLKV